MSGVSETVISLESVSVSFTGSVGIADRLRGTEPDTVHAVDDVSLDIGANDVVALVGESGCGKTTLGKTSIGLQRPTNGTVRYRGQDIWAAKDKPSSATIPHEEIRQALQIIHQDPGSSINPNRKVIKSLEVPLKQRRPELTTKERHEQIFAMLERVGIDPPQDYAFRYPHQLSGGEQQRVAITRALLMNPDAILADEAISALDVSLRIETMDLMLELQQQFETSFVFISHDLSNARYLATKAGGRIGIMYMGELVEIGPVEEVIENPKHPYTEVLTWATPDLDRNETGSLPVREIDVPDQRNPPSGCRFHTRCQYAREACVTDHPTMGQTDVENHHVGCFRTQNDHEYWDSPTLE